MGFLNFAAILAVAKISTFCFLFQTIVYRAQHAAVTRYAVVEIQ